MCLACEQSQERKIINNILFENKFFKTYITILNNTIYNIVIISYHMIQCSISEKNYCNEMKISFAKHM